MNMLSYVPDFEQEYEKQHGKKPGAALLRFIVRLNEVGKAFEDKGREDAVQELSVPSDDMFLAWGQKQFGDALEMAESIGELMRYCYMDGYNAGKAVS